jgi:spore germination cell wall hydrolase CwlJ-like protein
LATLVKTESVLNIITTIAVASTLALAGCATAEGKIVVNATTQDHKCLAEAIYFESGSEPKAGKIAVGHVIVNRVHSGIYPQTICSVVHQADSKRCQFGWTCRKHRTPEGIHWETSQQIATLILSGKTYDLSNGALSFRNRKYYRHSNKIKKTAAVGQHIFWRPKQLKAENRQGE